MDQFGEIISNIVAISIFIIFLLITLPLVIAIARIFILKFLFKREIAKKENLDDKVFLLVRIPPTNENKEDIMESFLHSVHRMLSQGTHISFEMLSSNQFLSF